MKLYKIVVLGCALTLLSACGSKCKSNSDDCFCKSYEKITQKEAIDLFETSHTKFVTNSVFQSKVEFYSKTDGVMSETPYSEDYLNGSMDESFMEFTCSEHEELKFLYDRSGDALYQFNGTSYVASSYEMNKTGGGGGTVYVGMSYARNESIWRNVCDWCNNTKNITNYSCENFIANFKVGDRTVTFDYFLGKDGLTMKRLVIFDDKESNCMKATVNLISFGDATPTHLS